jgi:hypothetical protein
MRPMRGRLFLYLALACFVALIAIFIADGYMGIYDTAYLTIGERQRTIEADYWLQEYPTPPEFKIDYYTHAEWGQKVFFRYEIDNRLFSTYDTTVQASLWQENEKLLDLFSEAKTIAPFDKAVAEWTLSTDELEPPVASTSAEYTVKINWGEVERNIVVDFFYPEVEPLTPPETMD